MTVTELIKKLQAMVADNPKLKKAKVGIEYRGSEGCDTCGYGSEATDDLEENKIYDLDTKLVLSVA